MREEKRWWEVRSKRYIESRSCRTRKVNVINTFVLYSKSDE